MEDVVEEIAVDQGQIGIFTFKTNDDLQVLNLARYLEVLDSVYRAVSVIYFIPSKIIKDSRGSEAFDEYVQIQTQTKWGLTVNKIRYNSPGVFEIAGEYAVIVIMANLILKYLKWLLPIKRNSERTFKDILGKEIDRLIGMGFDREKVEAIMREYIHDKMYGVVFFHGESFVIDKEIKRLKKRASKKGKSKKKKND